MENLSVSMSANAFIQHLHIVGAGHAHLFVLERLAMNPDLVGSGKVRVIAPEEHQYYSGMLPGLLMGLYSPQECRIPVKRWAKAAGASWIQASLVNINADERRLKLSDGQSVIFDGLSLATGGEIDSAVFARYQGKLLKVKPIEAFYQEWQRLQQQPPSSLAVVGGGAAGFEVLCAMTAYFISQGVKIRLYWVVGDQVLAKFPAKVRNLALEIMAELKVEVLYGIYEATPQGLASSKALGASKALEIEALVLATGTKPPDWLAGSGLQMNPEGIEVDSYHQSRSHRAIWAAGDLCSRPGTPLQASGVYAVRLGPRLAYNLEQSLLCATPKLLAYKPQRRCLYLLSCSHSEAIAVYGSWVVRHRLCWPLKRWIDQAFIRRFLVPKDG